MAVLSSAGGNWVSGEKFWGREAELEIMAGRAADGIHSLIVAQRRMGKTSLMRELARRLAAEYYCIFVDLEDAGKAEDAIVALSLEVKQYATFWSRVSGIFSNTVGSLEQLNIGDVRVQFRAALNAGNWQSKGDDLFSILAEMDKPVLLFLDEVPIMINAMIRDDSGSITPAGKTAASDFMQWLRKNSQKHQGKITLTMAGSIGLEPVLNFIGISAAINHIEPFELKPWPHETAIGCLKALAENYDIQYVGGAEDELVELLGYCIPHHVQMFFNCLHEFCKRKKTKCVNPEMVRGIYEKDMTRKWRAELSHYEERLKLVFEPDLYQLVSQILTETAVSGHLTQTELVTILENGGIERKQIMNVAADIMGLLEHDGYLEKSDGGFRFAFKLLEDWWKNRYAPYQTPLK